MGARAEAQALEESCLKDQKVALGIIYVKVKFCARADPLSGDYCGPLATHVISYVPKHPT